MNDEAVAGMRGEMINAAQNDADENEKGRPAVHKLRMLPLVIEMMQKSVSSNTQKPAAMLMRNAIGPRWQNH